MSSEGKTSVVQAQVTVPSVETVKDQLTPDLSGIPLVSTIAQGNVPSNKELNDAIDRTKEGLQSTKDEANLNLHGERLVKDASDILKSAQNFINEKNRGEKIQSLIKHTKEASDATSKQTASAYSRISSLLTSTLGFNFPTSEIKSDAHDAYDYGRELMLFAIRSKEFRSLLLDLINFFESAVDNASSQLLQLGDSLKTDVKNNNTNLTATSNQVDKTKSDVQDSIENKQAEWSAETKRAYYKRFQSLLNRISEKPEYKRLLDLYWKWMDDLKVRANEISETLKVKADQASNIAANAATKVANDSAFEKIWADVRAIVDEFAGQGEFDAFYNEMWNLYVEIVNDPAANAYFDSLRKFVVDAVNDPATLNNEAKQREGEELLYRGRRLMESPKFTARYNKTLRIINNFFDKISNDATTNDFAAKLKRFGEDLVLDSQGRPDLYVMQDSLAQVKNLVVPLLSKQLGSLSIAKLAGSNDSYDWSIEHLAVAIPNIIPEHFQLRTKNIIDINVKELETEKNNTKVVMELRALRPVFKDLKFWYQRKTFPRIEDYGTCDVDLSKGQGAKIKVIWKIKSKSNRPFAFSLMEVKCVIDSLDVTVKDAKHEYLDRLATTLFAASFKQSLAAGIVNALVDSVQPLNDQMNAWFATRPVASIYDRANEQVHSAFVQTNAAIKDRPVERIVEKVKDTYNTLADKANESIESAKEVLSEQAATVSSYVSEKSGDIKEAAIQAKDAVVEKAEEIKKEAEKLSDEAHTHVWQKVSKKTKPKKKHGPGVVNDADFPTLADGNKYDALAADSPSVNAI